ncbi:MAG: hypothetical protein R3F19_11645 [Verrucomicrobiales bacterium]
MPKNKHRTTPADPQALRRRRMVGSIIVGSIVAHGVLLAIFGVWIVAKHFQEPEATFEVVQKIAIPVQTPEHKMNMAQHEAMAPKPTFTDKLVSTRPAEITLPDLPEVDMDQMLPLDPSELVTDQITTLAGSAGMGSGQGSGLKGGGGTGDGMSFFDIKDNARSVVIMIDVSSSMFGRTGDYDYGTSRKLREGKDQSFQVIREQAFRLIDGLGVDSRFGIVHWSGSARSWKPELVRATDANKRAAKEHIQTNVDVGKAGPTGGRPGGTRHDYAIEALLELNPEIAFMLSDGNATRSLGRGKMETIADSELFQMITDARKSKPSIPRIHTIYYVTGNDKREEERMLRGISTRSGGKFRRVKAEKR